MRATKGPTSAETLSKLRRLQHKVDEAVGIAKTRWSRLLAQNIHNMSFSPKAAWANIRLLSKGGKSHHSAPKTIHMRLPSGELAECDEDNMRVFADNFTKVLNNQKNTDNEVVKIIWLREFM